jgi:hypothetical protein
MECFYGGRHEEFKDFLFKECGLVFYNDVCVLVGVLGLEYKTSSSAAV